MRTPPAWAQVVVAFVVGAVLGALVASNAETSECREARERLLSGEFGGARQDDMMEAYELACGRKF